MRFLSLTLLVFITMPVLAFDYPESRREGTTNTYHNVVVADPYQWMEDWSSAEVKSWSAAQNEVSRKYLDGLPRRDEIAKHVEAVISGDTVSYYSVQRVGDKAWFMKYAPPKQQPFLITIDADGNPESERIIYDPVTADESGSTSVEWFKVSPDGKLIGIALTVAGAEIAPQGCSQTSKRRDVVTQIRHFAVDHVAGEGNEIRVEALYLPDYALYERAADGETHVKVADLEDPQPLQLGRQARDRYTDALHTDVAPGAPQTIPDQGSRQADDALICCIEHERSAHRINRRRTPEGVFAGNRSQSRSALRTAATVSLTVSPSNIRRPVSISNRIAPNAQISER